MPFPPRPTARMMIHLLLLVVLLPLGHAAGADEAGADAGDPLAAALAGADAEILALLGDREVRLQAWGAWHAGARGITAAVPVLLDLIQRLPPYRPDAPAISAEERLLRLIACESLARLRPRLDGPDLDRLLADGDQVLALVLMAAEPERHRQRLWTLVEGRTPDLTWAAALNLLAADPASDVAPHLLAATTITLAVIVHDQDRVMEPWRGGRSRSQWSRMVRVPGFPLMDGSLLLSQSARTGSIVVAPGATTIFLGRGGIIDLDRNRHRIAILNRLIPAVSRTHPLSEREVIQVRWTGSDDLHHEIAAVQQALAARWRRALDALVAAGHLPVSAASMPPVRLDWEDQREDTTQALPDLKAEAPPEAANGF